MSNLALCRMCLASNTKMHHIADTAYQKIFEKLSTKLNTMSGLPESVCCVCMAHLQRCRQLMEMVRKAEDVLMQFTQSGMQLSEDTVSFLDRKFVRQLSWTNIQTLSIDEESNSPPVKAEIKDELSDDQNCITIEDEVISGFCGTNEILNRIYSSERNAVLWLTHVETNLTHTEMRIENFHDQTFPSEIDEPISDETVSQTVHSEIKNTEIPQNEQGTDHVIVEIKQELMEVPAEFEVEFTNTTEATTSRTASLVAVNPKRSSLSEDVMKDLDAVKLVPKAETNIDTGNDKNEKELTRKRSSKDTELVQKRNETQKYTDDEKKGSKSKRKCQRVMGDVCSCKRKCGEVFSDERRKCIFDNFWLTTNHEKKWDFIIKHVKAEDIKKMRLERRNNRTQTLRYSFELIPNDNSTMTNVCKKFFINTLRISEKFLYTAMEKSKFDEKEDKRGKHDNRPHKMNKNTEESAMTHIKLFPTKESHNLRETTKKLFLEETLNISKMYRLYEKWFQEQKTDIQMASKRQYETVFNTKFNYSFDQPKKDLCTACSIYNISDSENKNTLEEAHDKHIKNIETVRNLMNQDKESDPTETSVAIYDLEEIMLPQSEASIFHYKRKYPIYNLKVYDSLNKIGSCYLWHYQIAKDGAGDVGSCILHFIEKEYKTGIRNFIFYSDGCRQNKNRTIFSTYLYAAKKFGINIKHRYFVTGHSHSEADLMHSCIDRAKKNKIIYTPDQMYAIIMNAKINGKKFDLTEMKQSQFFDLKELVSKRFWLKTETGAKITWSDIHEISIAKEQPDILQLRYNYDEEFQRLNTWICGSSREINQSINHNLLVREFERVVSTPTASEGILKVAYSSKIKLPKSLYDDLLSCCRSGAIPNHYQRFYNDMQCGDNNETSDCGDSDSE